MPIDRQEAFWSHAGGVTLFLLGGLVGLSLPDLDRSLYWLRHFGLIAHRSAVTHGILLPLLVFLAAHARTRKPGVAADRALPLRSLAMGLCLAVAVHLSFDLFPSAWRGYARIHVPLYGWLGAWSSKTWLFLSAVGCVHLPARLLRNTGETLLRCLGLALWFGLHAAREPRAAWLVPFAFLPATFIGFVLPRPRRSLTAWRVRGLDTRPAWL